MDTFLFFNNDCNSACSIYGNISGSVINGCVAPYWIRNESCFNATLDIIDVCCVEFDINRDCQIEYHRCISNYDMNPLNFFREPPFPK